LDRRHRRVHAGRRPRSAARRAAAGDRRVRVLGMGRMEERVALVTGASSGIGRATASLLAAEGAAVALVALPGDELDAAAEECARHGRPAIAVAADVGDPAQVARAFGEASRLGPVDAVFNNAGISIVAPMAETTDEQWQRLLHTNLTGSFNVAREATRRMVGLGRGSLVNTAAEREENERSVAVGRLGRAEEIGAAVLFLLSDESSYVTGAQLVVDGGRTGCFPIGSIARGAS